MEKTGNDTWVRRPRTRWTRGAILAVTVALALAAFAPGAAAQDSSVVRISATQCDAPSEFDERTNEGALHEWIAITNHADEAVDIGGWTLEGDRDGTQDNDDFTLQSHVLDSGATVRVITGSGSDGENLFLHQEQGIWRTSGQGPLEHVWLNNTEGDSQMVVCDSGNFGGGVTVGDDETAPTDDEPTAPPADEEPEHAPAVCVENLMATPLQNATNHVTWDPVPGAEVYHVHLMDDGALGPLVALVEPGTTEFWHTGLEAGDAFEYGVAANWHPVDCPTAEATAIPFFQGALPLAAAVLGSVGLFALVRRPS